MRTLCWSGSPAPGHRPKLWRPRVTHYNRSSPARSGPRAHNEHLLSFAGVARNFWHSRLAPGSAGCSKERCLERTTIVSCLRSVCMRQRDAASDPNCAHFCLRQQQQTRPTVHGKWVNMSCCGRDRGGKSQMPTLTFCKHCASVLGSAGEEKSTIHCSLRIASICSCRFLRLCSFRRVNCERLKS